MNKRLLFFIFLALAVWSCSKSTPEEKPEPTYTLTVSASVDTTNLTKTYMEDGDDKGVIYWSSTDTLLLYSYGVNGLKSKSIEINESDKRVARFTFEVNKSQVISISSQGAYFFYGKYSNIEIDADNFRPKSITLNASQTYEGSKCFSEYENAAIGYVPSGKLQYQVDPQDDTKIIISNSISFRMRNLFGILRVNVSLSSSEYSGEALKISSLRLTDRNSSNYLAGKFSITYSTDSVSGDKIPHLQHVPNTGGESFTIEKQVNGGISGDQSHFVYFIVPPGTLSSSDGFDLAVYTAGGLYGGKTIKMTSGSIERSKITILTLTPFRPKPIPVALQPTANCYMFPAVQGIASIPAEYQGNGYQGDRITVSAGSHPLTEIAQANGLTSTGWKPVIIWQTRLNNEGIKETEVISNPNYFVKDNYHYISFHRSGQAGNALLGLVDANNKVIWSWHIWVAGNSEEECQQINKGIKLNKVDASSPDAYIMDRNVGALSVYTGSQSHGLAYQYARKDPFMGSATGRTSGTGYDAFSFTSPRGAISTSTISYTYIREAHMNPTVRTANDDKWCVETAVNWLSTNSSNEIGKTLYDPCPVGWRVIDNSDFVKAVGSSLSFAGSYTDSSSDDCVYATCTNLASDPAVPIYFPFSGSSNSNDSLNDVGNGSYIWCATKDSDNQKQASVFNLSKNGATAIKSDFLHFGYRSTMPVRCMKFEEPVPAGNTPVYKEGNPINLYE